VTPLTELWRWEPQGLGPYETIRSRLMWRVLLVQVALILPSVLVQVAVGPAWVALLPLVFVLNYGTSAWLVRRGRQQLAAWLVLAPSFGLPPMMAWFGGIEGTTTLYLQIAALFAVLWLEAASAAVVVALHVFLLATWPAWAPEVEQVFADPQAFQTAMLSSYLLAVSMVSMVAGSTIDALRRASAEAADRARDALGAAEAAVRATVAKARFLSMMSHELRTPLNAIVGYAELLVEDDGGSVRHRDPLERIGASGRRLLALVDELLEVSQSMRCDSGAPLPDVEDDPDDTRTRLVRRSVRTLLAGTLAITLIRGFGPDAATHVMRGVPFVLLFTAALALTAARQARAGAWLVMGLGLGWILAEVASGGPTSPEAPYLLLSVTAAWSWLGRRAGVAVTAAVAVALLAGSRSGSDFAAASDPWTRVAAHVSAILLSSAFLASVTHDLRQAARSARDGAVAAEAGAAAARDADEARDRFLARVSAELRAPLDAALRDAEVLRVNERDELRIADLDRICDAGRQLVALLDAVLDMRSLRRGELALRREAVDLAPLVDGAVRAMAVGAAARDDRISVRIPDGLPSVESDQQRVRQIVTSLLSNAVKHTRGGQIRVDVTEAEGELRVAVRDDGTGIPAERLADVFEPFVQLEDGPDRKPGIGLGLALSQQLAHRLGGRIDADSQVGAGSTFTLALPRR
jgi:signal transduction histidine kinase